MLTFTFAVFSLLVRQISPIFWISGSTCHLEFAWIGQN
jgi:hypothetical protein